MISKHIGNVFKEGKLAPETTCAKFAHVQTEGARVIHRQVDFYNLDVIISVGYRVKSARGTQFRIWATLCIVCTLPVPTGHGRAIPID